jgi:hypothetical protein
MNLQELKKLGRKPGTFDVPNPAELVQLALQQYLVREKDKKNTPGQEARA